ncbi:copper amine oxidase domain protein [Paenibacillus terrae HPL-003]|uniref:Copper amine oxidase domain protein n=1 Tax=Paenibacillus terrae (strain HPL-003) TaxID=985665 RepID=G7VXG1_PAETH|nr:copper amine oxidase N-terminal domain-containing protein [Paenibacillus terrae]AET59403.1 copper amine oxidase domain protein [Paenibacillus terrae HPL-003]
MNIKKWIAVPLILLMVALTGCQAVGGFDVSKNLLGTLDVKSQQSTEKISLKLTPKEGITQGDQEIVDLINSISVTVDEVKVQSEELASAKGTLHIDKYNLPFELALDRQGMAIQLEGAKKPYYISLNSQESLSGLPAGFDPYVYSKDVRDLTKTAAALVLKHAPNPSTISATSVTEEVYGEKDKVKLTRLHVELRGDELVTLVKPFLTNLAKDEAGLKELISQVIDFTKNIASSINVEGADQVTSELNTNKEKLVNEAYTEVKKYLDLAVAQYDVGVSTLYAQSPEIKTVLSSNTVLKTDTYFDEKGNVRKSLSDLTVALPEVDSLPVKSFSIVTEAQSWNVNGSVTADKVDISNGVIDLNKRAELTPGATLRNFDVNSPIYNILKNDLEITKVETTFDPKDDYYVLENRGGTAFIPLRELTYELGSELKWDATAKQITVVDDITSKTLKLKSGSKQVVLEGNTLTLPQAPYTDEYGSLYVPFKSVAEELGATVTRNSNGEYVLKRD